MAVNLVQIMKFLQLDMFKIVFFKEPGVIELALLIVIHSWWHQLRPNQKDLDGKKHLENKD